MQDLEITGRYRPVPPGFTAIWMGPGCVFYAHHSAVAQGVEMIERELRAGRLKSLPDGMTPVAMTINQQAWALAHTNVAGRA